MNQSLVLSFFFLLQVLMDTFSKMELQEKNIFFKLVFSLLTY